MRTRFAALRRAALGMGLLAAPEPGEEAVQVLVARANSNPSDPVVLEDRPCDAVGSMGTVR